MVKTFWSIQGPSSKPMQKASFDHSRKSQEFSGQVISKILQDMGILKLRVGGYNSPPPGL